MENPHNKQNRWKILSFVLMGLIAIPTMSAGVFPQAFADATSSILTIVTDIQMKINDPNSGLATKASQVSVNNLQTTANAIKSKTDNLPSDPAKQSTLNNVDRGVTNLLTEVGSIDGKLPADPASESTVQTRASQESLNSLLSQYLPLNFALVNTNAEGSRCNAPLRSHVNLSGCDLAGGSYGNVNLVKANLQGAHMAEASLGGANFFKANLINADLRLAGLSNTRLNFADLTNADLRGANLSGASLEGANFSHSLIDGATFTGCTGTPVGIPFSGGPLPKCS